MSIFCFFPGKLQKIRAIFQDFHMGAGKFVQETDHFVWQIKMIGHVRCNHGKAGYTAAAGGHCACGIQSCGIICLENQRNGFNENSLLLQDFFRYLGCNSSFLFTRDDSLPQVSAEMNGSFYSQILRFMSIPGKIAILGRVTNLFILMNTTSIME